VLVRREGTSVTLEPAEDWPADCVESFAGAPADFTRSPQGKSDKRPKLA